jgi:hypothetical protein
MSPQVPLGDLEEIPMDVILTEAGRLECGGELRHQPPRAGRGHGDGAVGFLVEEAPAGDARRCGYRLSKAGEAVFSSASWHIMVAEEILVGPLSEAERDTLKGLLQRLVQSGRL